MKYAAVLENGEWSQLQLVEVFQLPDDYELEGADVLDIVDKGECLVTVDENGERVQVGIYSDKVEVNTDSAGY